MTNILFISKIHLTLKVMLQLSGFLKDILLNALRMSR
ncbi:unnamed protein product [Trichobilharzia regenti]|nr:unnamed protein product [Trichobilharzia regenti]